MFSNKTTTIGLFRDIFRTSSTKKFTDTSSTENALFYRTDEPKVDQTWRTTTSAAAAAAASTTSTTAATTPVTAAAATTPVTAAAAVRRRQQTKPKSKPKPKQRSSNGGKSCRNTI